MWTSLVAVPGLAAALFAPPAALFAPPAALFAPPAAPFAPPAALFAPPAAPPGSAAALVRRGTELYKAGVYDKAAQAFEEAYGQSPTPTTALNLAQALEGAGRPAEAVVWYDKVLAAERAGPRREAAAQGKAHLAAHGFLAVVCGPPGAALQVGPEAGTCPTWGGYLPAGRHPVALTAPDRAPFRGTVDVTAGGRRELTLDLAREVRVPVAGDTDADESDAVPPADGGAAGPGTAPEGSPPAPADPAVPAWVGYTLLGVGGAALIFGGVAYGWAAADADAAPDRPSAAAAARRRALADDFDTHRGMAYGGLGAGAALLAGGGAVLLFGGGF